MNFLMAAFLLCPPQEGAEAFRVISDLVDAPNESEARKLAPFYREFLESELKAKRELGRLFGSAPRIRLRGQGRTFLEHLVELKNLGGNPTSGNPAMARTPFDIDVEAWPIEALALLCGRAGMRASGYSPWLDPMIHAYPIAKEHPKPPPPPSWFFYRNVAVQASSVGWRKIVDFSGPPRWTAGVSFQLLTDPQLPAVRCVNPRLIEALDENGRRLEPASNEDTALPVYESSGTWVPPMSFGIQLAAEGATKISRLRVAFTILVPTEVRRYAATEFDPAKPVKTGDEYFDVEFAMQQGESAANDAVTARVVPKKVRHADLAGIPIMLYQKFDSHGVGYPSGRGGQFSGNGEALILGSSWCTVRPADQVPRNLVEAFRAIRRPVRIEVAVPVGLKERTVYAEFRDIPLR